MNPYASVKLKCDTRGDILLEHNVWNMLRKLHLYLKDMLNFGTDHTLNAYFHIKATIYWWDCSKILLTSSLVSLGGEWKWYGAGSPIPSLDHCQKSLSFIPAIRPRNEPNSVTSIISITWMCRVRVGGCRRLNDATKCQEAPRVVLSEHQGYYWLAVTSARKQRSKIEKRKRRRTGDE